MTRERNVQECSSVKSVCNLIERASESKREKEREGERDRESKGVREGDYHFFTFK